MDAKKCTYKESREVRCKEIEHQINWLKEKENFLNGHGLKKHITCKIWSSDFSGSLFPK